MKDRGRGEGEDARRDAILDFLRQLFPGAQQIHHAPRTIFRPIGGKPCWIQLWSNAGWRRAKQDFPELPQAVRLGKGWVSMIVEEDPSGRPAPPRPKPVEGTWSPAPHPGTLVHYPSKSSPSSSPHRFVIERYLPPRQN